MASVTFAVAVGGDGSVVTDDTNPSTGLAAGGHRTRFVPALAQLVAVSQYVVNTAQGMSNGLFTPCRISTTANHGLSGLTAIDGITPIANDRIFVPFQSTGSQNGIYVAAAGAWTRATDADGSLEWVGGKCVTVQEGTLYGDTMWQVTNDGAITIGSTALTFQRRPSLALPNTWTGLQTFNAGLAVARDDNNCFKAGTYHRLMENANAIGSLAIGSAIQTYNAEYNSGWKKIASGYASAWGVYDGTNYHYVSSAGAGSAGDAITWVLQATIDTAGVIKQGTTGVVIQGKHSFFIPAKAFKARTTNGAASGSEETATNKLNFDYFDFDTTTKEFIQALVAMPKHWNGGTITFEPWWRAPSGSGGVAWGLSGVAISDDDVLDAAFGTEVIVTDTLIATTDLHKAAESAAVTIAGTPAVGDLVMLQVARVPADAGDTLAADARFMGIRIFYTVDKANDA